MSRPRWSSAPADPLAVLRDEEPGPLYFLYGKERFLVERALDLLRGRLLDPRTRDFNQDVFFGKDGTASRIIQAARTMPMMARRRLVVVRDADEMKADHLTALVPYLTAPCRESCVVFVGEKVDQRLKFFGAFKKHGVLVKLDPLYDRQLPGFVRQEAADRQVQLEPGAAEHLAGEIGSDLGQLADAVERLAIYVGSRPISAADVEEMVSSTRQRTIFELANAVGERNRGRALAALQSLLANRESGVRIVSMLARHVRQLWVARNLLAQGKSKQQLAAELGIPPFFVDGIESQARRLDSAALQQMHRALFEVDWELKSARLDDARLLEAMVVELTAPAPRRAGRV